MINPKKISKVYRNLRLLNRWLVIAVMKVMHESTPMTVTEIRIAICQGQMIDITQPEISQALAIMRRVGVAKYKQDGKCRKYWIDTEYCNRINKALNNFKTQHYETVI